MTHDPFAGHSPIAVERPAPPPAPLHHRVVLDWDGEMASHIIGFTDENESRPRVRIPLDDNESREWGSQDAIGAGDVVRFIDRADPDRWMEGKVIEVGVDDRAEWAAVDTDTTSAEDEALRAELRGVTATTYEQVVQVDAGAQGAGYPDTAVPSQAAAVLGWVKASTGPEDEAARRAAAWRVEAAREGGPRKTVAAEIEPF